VSIYLRWATAHETIAYIQILKDQQLGIFARVPEVGKVKTRLIPALGEEGALAAYQTLLNQIAQNLQALQDVSVFYTPEQGENKLKAIFPQTWKYSLQIGDNLGSRLLNAFEQLLQRWTRAVIIGGDCPFVNEDDIQSAFNELRKNEVVLGPAKDGGYWLIGMRSLHAELFQEISWGTSTVFEQTLEKSRGLNLNTGVLRELNDIDTPDDWAAFQQYQKTGSMKLN
jgi:rSAM/selenodomain-associated transferase 1